MRGYVRRGGCCFEPREASVLLDGGLAGSDANPACSREPDVEVAAGVAGVFACRSLASLASMAAILASVLFTVRSDQVSM